MAGLAEITAKLNEEFNLKSFGKDDSFSRFIPRVYEAIGFDWRKVFESEFGEIYNGLMLKGSSSVEKVFLAVFPTDHVLERFIGESKSGDLLFMHHPLLMECGDPKGQWGRGFVPIKETYIRQMNCLYMPHSIGLPQATGNEHRYRPYAECRSFG